MFLTQEPTQPTIKLKISTQLNPTRGSTQPMDNSVSQGQELSYFLADLHLARWCCPLPPPIKCIPLPEVWSCVTLLQTTDTPPPPLP